MQALRACLVNHTDPTLAYVVGKVVGKFNSWSHKAKRVSSQKPLTH
jgi:hypothetical protein